MIKRIIQWIYIATLVTALIVSCNKTGDDDSETSNDVGAYDGQNDGDTDDSEWNGCDGCKATDGAKCKCDDWGWDDCDDGLYSYYDCDLVLTDQDGNPIEYEEAVAVCESGDEFALCVLDCVDTSETCDELVNCVSESCYQGDDTTDDDMENDATCWFVADGMVFGCGVSLDDGSGGEMGVAQIHEWCQMSEDALDAAGFKVDSPTWSCFWGCVNSGCDIDCFNICTEYTGPGDESCADTVDNLYECGVTWGLDATGQYFWWPADLALICEALTDWPWDCYDGCEIDFCPDDQDRAKFCVTACDA